MSSTVSITNTLKAKLPSLAFESIKNAVLGKNYILSIVAVNDARSRALNKVYRGKDKPADVLSFEITATEGELFLNPARIRKTAPDYGKTFPDFFAFLFIHGLFHLKGMDHSSKMESKERRVREKFGFEK